MKITDTHVYFYTNFLSNWYPTKNIGPQFIDPIHNLTWNNTEEAYMWYKAYFFLDAESCANIALHSANKGHPSIVKELGQKVINYNNDAWSIVRYSLMVYVNYLKYSQNEDLKQKLLNTGDRILVEASPIDKVWGVGLAENDPLILNEKNWTGQNLLGKALMEVRQRVK